MRERGLKQHRIRCICQYFNVVPRAGTWIETLLIIPPHIVLVVVPRAGTWIETVI